ncbi:unnamed protein product, partial [Closterium sp. NIES-54]
GCTNKFYHPISRRVLSSQDVTFDESVCYYRVFPYRTASLRPPPLFLAPGTPPVDPLPCQGPSPSGVSQVDPAEPVEVAVDSCAARGAEPAGAGPGSAEPRGAEPERVEPGGAESGGAEPARAESGGSPGVPLQREPLSPQRLREWYARRCCSAAGAAGARAVGGAAGAGGATGAGAAGGAACARAAGGAAGAGAAGGAASAAGARAAGAVGPGGARTGGTGAAGAGGTTGVGAAGTAAGGAAGVVTGDPGAEGTGAVSAVPGGAAQPRPYYVPLLQQVLGLPPSPGPAPPLLSPPLVQSQSQLQPASSLPGPSPYSGPTRGLTERREPESRPVSPVSRSALPVRTARAGRRVSRPRPPPVPGTHSMTLRPSTAPQRVPLPSPPASSLLDGPDPESDSLRATSPTVTHFLTTAFTDPLFESSVASALVAELVDFGAACRLDYATSLVVESASASVCPLSVGDIPTPCSYAEAIEGLYCSQWQAAMDAEIASWKSTGTYVDEVAPPGANIVSGMWIFRVKRPPGSPPVFKARYVARGFSQRQGVDFFQTNLRVLLHVAVHRDYELHSLDFSTAFLQGSLHEEIRLRRPPGFSGSFLAGTQWSLRRPVYGLRQALHDLVFATVDTEALAHMKSELQKRHTCTDLGELTSYLSLRITRDRAQRTITLTQSHMVQQVLQRFGFTYSSPLSTPMPTGHSLSAPPSDESVEPSGPYSELVGNLMFPTSTKSREPCMGIKGLGPKLVSKLRLACALVAVNLKPTAWVAVLFPDTWEEQMPKTVVDMAKQTAPVLRPPTKRKKAA